MKKNIKFIVEILSLLFIGIPIAVSLYLSNEIFWMLKRLKK